MEKMAAFIAKNFISIIGVTILTGATVTTSVMGVAKVASTLHPTQLEVPVQHSADTSSTSSVSSASSSSAAKNSSGNSSVRPASRTLAPVVIPAVSSSSSQSTISGAPQTSGSQCIITLFGKQYNVSPLINSHPGGNVFVCGTDQTALYQSQHGNDVSRMQPYLVTGGTTGSTGGGTGANPVQQGGNAPSRSRESEHESEPEHRDEDHKEEVETHSESRLLPEMTGFVA